MDQSLRHYSQVTEALSILDNDQVNSASEIIRIVRGNRGNVWIAGNGGSASTAAHLANDLSKMCRVRAIAISDMSPTTLAHGNDDGWENMFSAPLALQIRDGDAIVGISCSGNSANIVSFLNFKNAFRIALTGPGESKISRLNPNVIIRAMSDEITVIEDIHSIICHAIARSLR